VRLAGLWADPTKHKRFDLMILAVIAVIISLTLVMIFVMGWAGLSVMSFLYGIDFEQFRGLCFIMLVAGGVTACIDFLYQVITVLREHKSVMGPYLITLGFSLFIPVLLVSFTGLPGIVIGYLIVMSILFVLLVGEYLRIRYNFARQIAAEQEEERRLNRRSELIAERERRQRQQRRIESMNEKRDRLK
jgi:O-antigen/teichoic acid export membrane protein